VSPHKPKIRGELPALATPPRVGPKTLANPEPTRVGKRGVQGAQAPWRGVVGGVPPQTKIGSELSALATPPRVGPKTLANPEPTRVGKWGWRGRSPIPGGLGDVPPRVQNKGRAALSCNPAPRGTQNAGRLCMKDVALLCPYSAQAGFSRQDGAKFLTKSCFAVKMQIREGKMMLGFPLPCPIPRSFPAPGSG
jgi:hypothetical protein